MPDTLIRVPITGNAVDIATTEIELAAGLIVVLSLEAGVNGKLTLGSASDGILILFEKGPHGGPETKDPPPGDAGS